MYFAIKLIGKVRNISQYLVELNTKIITNFVLNTNNL
jgi:hypothetical protein